MKIRIEVTEGLPEDEVVIRCAKVDDTIQKINQFVLDTAAGEAQIVFYKQNQAFYFPLDEVLFFETDGEKVYAHTAADAFQVRQRLYELEELLPRHFLRVAKATIVNLRQIYSVTRNLTAASLIQFAGTHKQIYASRHYYQTLRQRLEERNVKP